MSAEKHERMIRLGLLNPDGTRKEFVQQGSEGFIYSDGIDAVAEPDPVALTATTEE